MTSHTDDRLFLRLAYAQGLGARTVHKLLSTLGDVNAIFSASQATLAGIVGDKAARTLVSPPESQTQLKIDDSLNWLAQETTHHLLTWAHPAYPAALLESGDAPVVLYAKGRLELLANPALAVVGSRNCSQGGGDSAEAFAQAIAERGVTIISGMALGIDAAAHVGALRAATSVAGSTIAVIGTGIDRVYPARNKTLAHSIAEQGLMLSEYPLGTPPLAENFPRRNRIISGLSMGVLVVEASMASGSLITARLAADQGREVFAIPGSIHSTFHKGCHHLIKQGAKLVETAQDVLEELKLDQTPAHALTASAVPQDAVVAGTGAHLEYSPVSVDQLAARSGLPVAQIVADLSLLELQGQAEKLADGNWQRRG